MRLLLLSIPVLALGWLLIPPALAQAVPAVGTDATFDVATWNIERFGDAGPPDNQTQFDNVLAVMQQAEVDLWALQEINDENDFNDLVDALAEGWDGDWTPGAYGSIGYGYVYRTDVVDREQFTLVLEDDAFEFAGRPPALLRADVTLPGGTVGNVRFLDLHAKAGGGFDDWNRRRDASEALKGYTDNFVAIGARVLVLGDLNDEIEVSISSGRASPYANFRDDDDYRFASLPIEQAGEPTFCSNTACTSGSTLDHVLLSEGLFDAYVEGSAARYDELLDALPSYTSTTSDHLPVYARFNFFGTSTGDDVVPKAFALQAPFPNPFQTETTLTFALPEAADVRLEAFDALGRRVGVIAAGPRPAGTHRVRLPGDGLAPGLYLVRLTASGPDGERTATRRLVRVP